MLDAAQIIFAVHALAFKTQDYEATNNNIEQD